MENLTLSSTPSPTIPRRRFIISSNSLPITRIRTRTNVWFYRLNNPKKFTVFASKSDPSNSNNNKLDEWDIMELKFGRMLGEDPNLTLAKIMGRKTNPDASYIEIEKNFYKSKGKPVEVKEVPFDVPEKLGSTKALSGLNLIKPEPKNGIKVGIGEDNSKLPDIKRPNESIRYKIGGLTKSGGQDNLKVPKMERSNESGGSKVSRVTKSNVPNVILRKPSVFNENDDEGNSSSRLRIKPNLSLSMRTEPVKEKFSGMTLLKKPEPVIVDEDHGGETENSLMNESAYGEPTNGALDSFDCDVLSGGQSLMTSYGELKLSEKPKATAHQDADGSGSTFMSIGMADDDVLGDHIEGLPGSESVLMSHQGQPRDGSETGVQSFELTDAGYSGNETGMSKPPTAGSSGSEFTVESSLLGRPSRLGHSLKKMSNPIREETVSTYPEGSDGQVQQDKLSLSRPLKGDEETDWTRVEQRCNLGDRVDVELISCSPRGFVVSFGSLIGFLPYRNLAAKWKFLAFESWLRKNGLDPSKYRQNLGIIGNDEVPNKNSSLESSLTSELSPKKEFEVTSDMELEDLLKIYDQEKMQYLSSYVGQVIKVNIVLADKKSRKLIFSMRPKENQEIVERKRKLMAKLSIGDIVKCCIKKITYFGIFVEVDGVPALIHQTEVSWDVTLDPSSYLKIGQIVEAKVHQLDFSSERIFLSLKEISPDPLNEALECIVGNTSFNGGLEAAQADLEWAEVDSLIKELQEIDGVQTVAKGRFFLSPGLAPTFQVYMASMFENQYKLLARSGNKVQEVIVQASLDKEQMKSAILRCTNRVQ